MRIRNSFLPARHGMVVVVHFVAHSLMYCVLHRTDGSSTCIKSYLTLHITFSQFFLSVNRILVGRINGYFKNLGSHSMRSDCITRCFVNTFFLNKYFDSKNKGFRNNVNKIGIVCQYDDQQSSIIALIINRKELCWARKREILYID